MSRIRWNKYERSYLGRVIVALVVLPLLSWHAIGTTDSPANASELDGTSGAAAILPCHDLTVELPDLLDCMAGPGAPPAPVQGLSLADCLDLFDSNDDGSVDMSDYSAFLTAPAIEFGYSFSQPYECMIDGSVMPVFHGLQGGTHIFVTLRGKGFPLGQSVNILRRGVMVDDQQVAIPDGEFLSVFTDLGGGVGEMKDLFLFMLLFPDEADGREMDLTFIATDPNDSSVTATVTHRVLLAE